MRGTPRPTSAEDRSSALRCCGGCEVTDAQNRTQVQRIDRGGVIADDVGRAAGRLKEPLSCPNNGSRRAGCDAPQFTLTR